MNAPLLRAPSADESVPVVPGGNASAAPKRTMRRRRRGQREADKVLHNHQTDRWMVSYADFITLLFAFFVVMYAMSSVNEGRYRVLSGALSTAFSAGAVAGDLAVRPPAPVDGARNQGAAADAAKPAAVVEPPVVEPPVAEATIDPVERAELERAAERMRRMQRLATAMDLQLTTLVSDGQVKVTRGARGIAIEINAAVLFDPAHAELKPASFEALRSVAHILSSFVEPLQIEGHSDDLPIASREYRSNWELSAARAASVGRFLIDQGIAPGRIGIAGYAEFRPLVGNVDAESRARNRRVTLVVLSADDARPEEGPARGDAPATPETAPAGSDITKR